MEVDLLFDYDSLCFDLNGDSLREDSIYEVDPSRRKSNFIFPVSIKILSR